MKGQYARYKVFRPLFLHDKKNSMQRDQNDNVNFENKYCLILHIQPVC